jgi:Flp pilus assembly protein TadB
MPEIQIEYIYLGIAIASAAAVAFGFFYRRGKKEGIDESCAKRIEEKLDSVAQKLDSEIQNTNESHRQMHEKINAVKTEVAYIKGKLDHHLGIKSD